MAPSLIARYSLVTSAVDSSTLTTPSFTPSNGEVIVVKAATWDSGTSMSTPTGGSQTYTQRVASTVGGFRPYVAIWTATISGSPGSMTISSTPSASSWHDMVVERWSSAQLAATPVTNSLQGGTGAASSTLTTTAPNSVISWVAGDAQSTSPAARVYLNSGTTTEELVDDQSTATNGVWYYVSQTVASAGSTSYGLSAPTPMQWWIAGVEILDNSGAAQAVATTPIVVTRAPVRSAAMPLLLRNTQLGVVFPAGSGRAPLVVTQPGPLPAAAGLLIRGTLADPPVLTTAPPMVVSRPPSLPAPAAILARNAAPAAAAPAASTASPYVVTASPLPPPATALLLRSSLADAPVLTTASPLVVTATAPVARPAAILVRPLPADSATPGPLVVTTPAATVAATAILARAPQSPIVQTPAATAQPTVVTASAAPAPGITLLSRGSLADAPVLTSASPIVLTTPARPPSAAAFLARNPQPFIPPVPGPTTRPIVVTAVRPGPPGLTLLIRGAGTACDCLTHRPNAGTTTRPTSGITARPTSGITARPVVGTIVRPSAGVTARPCTCQGG